MTGFTRKDFLEVLAGMEPGQDKTQLFQHLIENKEIGEDELAHIIKEDSERPGTLRHAVSVIESSSLLRELWTRFQDSPEELSRLVVLAYPDFFYTRGFATRVILKLKAHLGPVIIRPRTNSDSFEPTEFLQGFANEIRKGFLHALSTADFKRVFRQYLYYISTDSSAGLAMLKEDSQRARTEYERSLFAQVYEYAEQLLALRFEDFVPTMSGKLFPAFHVRWWIDQVKTIPRSLNIGDTGTQKTAFAVVSAHEYGHTEHAHTLVICTERARAMWGKEINTYYRTARDRVHVIHHEHEVRGALEKLKQYTVIGYSTLIRAHALERLCDTKFDQLIWDEAHYGNNVTGATPSQRARACRKLVTTLPLTRIMALTATPWENHPLEIAAIACALKPEVFPEPESFMRARPEDARLLREFLDEHVLEVELPEVQDLPPITPKPHEDLFAATLIPMNATHDAIYSFIREDDEHELLASQKVQRLLLCATHPHAALRHYPEAQERFGADDEIISTKLVWLKEKITQKLAEGAKVVVATGIYIEGITLARDEHDETWVGAFLQRWFGEDAVLIIDGSVSQVVDARSGMSRRSRAIERWRTEPGLRVLLVSQRACPDSINLTIPTLPGITKVFITTISNGWVPWKQFLGRFWRPGQEVPVEYEVPVLSRTIDESLLHLLQDKWEIQQLFRRRVPLTKDELELLEGKADIRRLGPDTHSSLQHVSIINTMMQGAGEAGVQKKLLHEYGDSTNGEIFARSFIASQEYATSGHIARCMVPIIQSLEKRGLVYPEVLLDAGCGPLTLERHLHQPVYGIDLNGHILDGARPISPHNGTHARVGTLSKLPYEWTGKFALTVASLVLDWTSIKVRNGAVCERIRILDELARVTHGYGRLWITATKNSMNETLLADWVDGFRRQGFEIIEDLTGLVEATDIYQGRAKFHEFAFWSLCVCPNGNRMHGAHGSSFMFTFEQERVRVIHGAETKKNGTTNGEVKPPTHVHARHEQFIITPLGDSSASATSTVLAGENAGRKEIARITTTRSSLPHDDARVIRSLYDQLVHVPPKAQARVLREMHKRNIVAG